MSLALVYICFQVQSANLHKIPQKMVRQLIDLGADPNEPCCSFWSKDPSQGDTGKTGKRVYKEEGRMYVPRMCLLRCALFCVFCVYCVL